MKFQIRCLVSSVNSSALSDAQATVKGVEVQNPSALLSSVRAKAGIAFRLNLGGFSLVYRGDRPGVSLADEKMMLSECGLEDGDTILLVSKRVRETNGTEPAGGDSDSGSSPAKVARPEGSTDGAVAAAVTGDSQPSAASSSSSLLGDGGEEDVFADASDEDDVVEEGAVDIDLDAMALGLMLGEGADAAAGQLYSRLLEVVPNLVELRQQFLSDPRAVMERIQREDLTLFQLITAHQAAFISLINNEQVITTMQNERDGNFGDDEEELDEEALENLLGMFGEGGMEDDDDDMAALEAMEEGGGDDGGGAFLGDGGGGETDKARILAFAPSDDDEAKIQHLTQLGFAYDVCKLAFYMARRSLDRAAHLLFENPPQL